MISSDALLLRVFMVGIPLLVAGQTTRAADEQPTYGSWTVRCEETSANDRKGCFIFQNLVLREGGHRVLQVAVGYVPESKDPVVLLSLPLGISLPPGVSMRGDEGDPKRFAVERCEPAGCRAGFRLDEELLKRFGSGERITVTFHDGRRQPIEVPLSLDGFTEGLRAIGSEK